MHSVLFFIFLSSCSFFTTEKPVSAKQNYSLPSLPKEWKKEKSNEFDYLYFGPDSSSLMIQSFCNEFQSLSLKNLAITTFSSLDRAKIIKQENIIFKNRKALRTLGEAELDGIKFFVTLINLRRDNCYFDILEFRSKEESSSIINKFVDGLEFK